MEVRDSLEDKIYASCPLQKGLPSHFTWADIWRQMSCLLITVFFLKLPRYSLFLNRQSKQRIVNTLLMIRINPTCNRVLIFICQGKKQKPGLHLQ